MNHGESRASSNPSPDVAMSGGLPRLAGTGATWAPTPVDAEAFAPASPAAAATPEAAVPPTPQAPTGWSPTSWRIDR